MASKTRRSRVLFSMHNACDDNLAFAPVQGIHNLTPQLLNASIGAKIAYVANPGNCTPSDPVLANLPANSFAAFVAIPPANSKGWYPVHIITSTGVDVTPSSGLVGQFCGHGKSHSDDAVVIRKWVKNSECKDDGNGHPTQGGMDQDGSEAPPMEMEMGGGSSLIWVTVADDCFPMSQPPDSTMKIMHDSGTVRKGVADSAMRTKAKPGPKATPTTLPKKPEER